MVASRGVGYGVTFDDRVHSLAHNNGVSACVTNPVSRDDDMFVSGRSPTRVLGIQQWIAVQPESDIINVLNG